MNKPYRLISLGTRFFRLAYNHKQPEGSVMHVSDVTGCDGLLLPKWRKKPIFRGDVLRGGE